MRAFTSTKTSVSPSRAIRSISPAPVEGRQLRATTRMPCLFEITMREVLSAAAGGLLGRPAAVVGPGRAPRPIDAAAPRSLQDLEIELHYLASHHVAEIVLPKQTEAPRVVDQKLEAEHTSIRPVASLARKSREIVTAE